MRAATRTEGGRIATPHWQAAIATRARFAVDDDTWTALLSAEPAAACTRFAQLARSLASADDQSRELLERLLDTAVPGNAAVARTVAGQITRRLTEVGAGTPDTTHLITTLRVLGVHVCATAPRDLADCRCLRDMIDEDGLTATKRALQDGLSILASTG
ncbi:hypothetical protein CLV40_106217 [Actinokineospora auranticolor]|uniref:Uncharacterized protein n=2 Tax=Actinokineospora auranticolor TaxID=155976 RepID=A0A2S6GRV4_9PSEU|nr:hypothetical protein CLV40_106217 [Actinokineospora auranticolor]